MKHKKILNLLNEVNDYKFLTRKWNIVNDQSNANYDVGNEIIYNTEVLKSNLCDYNDAYFLVSGDITVTPAPATQVSFKNCAPFTKCITKIDGTTIDDAEILDLIMAIYNLIEYLKQVILMQTLLIAIIVNLSSIRPNYWETQLLKTLRIKLIDF